LGYTRPADGQPRYTISREKHVEVDGKFADAVLGQFNGEPHYFVALEGKGPRDPLDRPFAGRSRRAGIGRRPGIPLKGKWDAARCTKGGDRGLPIQPAMRVAISGS
jgi:hypothetical protein